MQKQLTTPGYDPPYHLPIHWQDEISGVLPAAVLAFFDDRLGRITATETQVELVRAFCEYYINAPGWDIDGIQDEQRDELNRLREHIKTLHTTQDIDEWINECMMLGLDPL